MEEEITERTVHLSRRSFILTIPQTMAREAGIRKGQGVRFRVRDGETVASPPGIPGDGMPDSAGSDARAITEVTAKNSPEKPSGRGVASGKSRPARLRIK